MSTDRDSKFVQITAVPATSGTFNMHNMMLFALDDEGAVWSYQSGARAWSRWPNTRIDEERDR